LYRYIYTFIQSGINFGTIKIKLIVCATLYLFHKRTMTITLPQEIMDEILSYGDPFVTQKYEAVVNQINYHRKMLEVDSRLTMFYLRLNVYSGITSRDFYLYILDKSYMKKNVYYTTSKYFGKYIL
jgi:hypothetical protein